MWFRTIWAVRKTQTTFLTCLLHSLGKSSFPYKLAYIINCNPISLSSLTNNSQTYPGPHNFFTIRSWGTDFQLESCSKELSPSINLSHLTDYSLDLLRFRVFTEERFHGMKISIRRTTTIWENMFFSHAWYCYIAKNHPFCETFWFHILLKTKCQITFRIRDAIKRRDTPPRNEAPGRLNCVTSWICENAFEVFMWDAILTK